MVSCFLMLFVDLTDWEVMIFHWSLCCCSVSHHSHRLWYWSRNPGTFWVKVARFSQTNEQPRYFCLCPMRISGFQTPDSSIMSIFFALQVDPNCEVFVQEQEDTPPGTWRLFTWTGDECKKLSFQNRGRKLGVDGGNTLLVPNDHDVRVKMGIAILDHSL